MKQLEDSLLIFLRGEKSLLIYQNGWMEDISAKHRGFWFGDILFDEDKRTLYVTPSDRTAYKRTLLASKWKQTNETLPTEIEYPVPRHRNDIDSIIDWFSNLARQQEMNIKIT